MCVCPIDPVVLPVAQLSENSEAPLYVFATDEKANSNLNRVTLGYLASTLEPLSAYCKSGVSHFYPDAAGVAAVFHSNRAGAAPDPT